MTADPLTVGMWLLSWGATYLVHSTCLLGGCWLWLRLRPASGPGVRETLWKTALVGGLLTTPAQLLLNRSASIGEFELVVPARSSDAAQPDAAAEGRGVNPLSMPDVETADLRSRTFILLEDGAWRDLEFGIGEGPNHVVARREAGGSRAETVAFAPPGAERIAAGSRQRPVGLTITLALIAAGASFVIGIGRYVWQTTAWRRVLSGAQELDAGPARLLLDELCRVVPRGRPVRLLAAPRCSEPAAYGLLQWTIVLPARAERDLSEDELRSLLAHELGHLVRGDMWWLFLSRLVCSGCGFQPLNHFARREWQRAAEQLCDAWAVSRTGSRLALARCLTEVAGWRWSRPECGASLAATGRGSGLAARIERLIDDGPLAEPWNEFRVQRKLGALAGVVLIGIVGFGPRVKVSSGAPQEVRGNAASANLVVHPRATIELVPIATTEREIDPPRPSTEAAAPFAEIAPQPVDLAELIAALDRELRELERELAELQPLLSQPLAPLEAKRLGASLRRETSLLHGRRAILSRLLEKPVVVRPTGPEKQDGPL